jgi:glutathione synthase/RimK-type ligase-like ATP-grasp enzyme
MFTHDGVKRVFCRMTLTGSGGEGIHIARKPTELVNCHLYVEGIPKAEEYRIHVLHNKVVDVQEKRAKNGASKDEGWNAEIRNHQYGWVFVREGVNPPKAALQEAIKAVAALGLDFGAVDLAIDKRDKKPKVFEVNTSPGLEGTTLDNYANAFTELISSMQARK